MSTTAVRTPAEYEAQLQKYFFERSEEAPRGSRRREGGLGAGRDRRALSRSLHTRRRSKRCARRSRRRGRRARAALPAAQDVRGEASSRPSSPSRKTRSRTRSRRPADVPRRGDAAPLRAGEACGARVLRRPRRARRAGAHGVGRLQRRPAHAMRRASGSRPRSRASPIPSRATRRRRRSRSASSSACSLRRRMRRRTHTAACATPGSRSCSAPSAMHSRRMRTSTISAGCRRSNRRTRRSARSTSAWRAMLALGFDMTAIPEHPARPRGPAAEEPACLRDPVGSARGRASDHARAGRALRLPGVHARGRPRTPLRGRRSAAAVHVPQASRATTR